MKKVLTMCLVLSLVLGAVFAEGTKEASNYPNKSINMWKVPSIRSS